MLLLAKAYGWVMFFPFWGGQQGGADFVAAACIFLMAELTWRFR